jgi:hypothetical protein
VSGNISLCIFVLSLREFNERGPFVEAFRTFFKMGILFSRENQILYGNGQKASAYDPCWNGWIWRRFSATGSCNSASERWRGALPPVRAVAAIATARLRRCRARDTPRPCRPNRVATESDTGAKRAAGLDRHFVAALLIISNGGGKLGNSRGALIDTAHYAHYSHRHLNNYSLRGYPYGYICTASQRAECPRRR